MVEDNERYRLYPYFPHEEGRNFEIYKVEIEEGGYLSAKPHTQASYEFITVFDGEITISVGEEEFAVLQGEALKFRADKPHAYRNSGKDLACVNLVIYYPE